MPTLEERVQKLEDEVRDIRSRTDVNEAETVNLAELIKVESRFTNSKIDRLSRDMTEMRRDVTDLKRDMTDVKQELKALPRVIAEVVRETVAELKPRG